MFQNVVVDAKAKSCMFQNVVVDAKAKSCMFQNVVVDACVLDNDSGLLQQACDITSGIYLKVPQMSGLLQYLLVSHKP